MPVSGTHEVLIEIVTLVPGLLPRLVEQSCGTKVPEHTDVVPSGEAANIKVPLELRADAVRILTDEDGAAQLAVVVEVQRRCDHDKYWVWPVLLAHARRLHRCSAALLVVAPDDSTAFWARQPIDLGLGRGVVQPLVVNLQALPPVTDIAAASQNIGYAMLAAIPRHDDTKYLEVVASALDNQKLDDAKQYSGLMMTALHGAAQEYWRKLMSTGTYAYQNEYARELLEKGEARGEAKGEIKGEAKAILTILRTRGINVTDDTAALIHACTDPTQLETWTAQAIYVTAAEELFSHQ